MAQPAAVLGILVTANTKQAQAALGKTQAQLGATTKAANASTVAMRRMGTAAKWGGAIMAGGLYFGLKKSVEEAREANKVMAQTDAVLKSTGGAAKVTAAEVENLARKLSEKSGIDDEAIQSGENLLLTFKNIRNEAGEGNKIFNQTTSLALDMSAALGQDMKSSAIQLGKALNDPSVGLTALRRVGVSFTEQQTEQILAMQESGDLMGAQKKILAELTSEFKGSAKAQADAGDRLRVIFDNMAEDIGQKAIPVLEDMATKVSNILSDKKLTGEQKAAALADYFTKMFSKGLDALEDALPQIAEAGGRMGLKLVESFGKAFLEADVLGKIFLGGLLVRALGGRGAIAALGVALGKLFGSSFGGAATTSMGRWTVAPGGTPIPGNTPSPSGGGTSTAGKLAPLALASRAAGPVALAASLPVIGDALQHSNIEKTEEAIASLGQSSEVSAEQLRGITQQYRHLSDATVLYNTKAGAFSFKPLADDAEKVIDTIKAQYGSFKKAGRAMSADQKDAWGEFVLMLRQSGEITDKQLRRMVQGFGKTKRDVIGATEEQTRIVGGSIGGMVNVVGHGLKVLGSNTNKALRAFNAKAVSFAIETVGTGAGNVLKQQRGGPINVGAPSGDSVPAMLERGEYVLNRKAVSAVGKDKLDAINFGAARRFQTGGMAGGISSLASSIAKKFGLTITSGYRPGDDGYHGQGLAADLSDGFSPTPAMNAASRYIQSSGIASKLLEGIYSGSPNLSIKNGQQVSPSFWGASTWAAHGNHIHLALSGALGPVAQAQTLKALKLSGPAGPLRSMGQGSLDMAYKAASGFLSKQSSGPVASPSGGAMSKTQIASVWSRANKGLGNPNLMAAIALAESSGNPSAVGHDPGGTRGLGLWQITTGFNSDLINKYGGEQGMFNPVNNAKAAGDILARQGLGAWVVYNTGAYQQFMQKGGMPSLDTGGRVTKAGIAEVHPGDVHVGKGAPQVRVVFADGMGWLRDFMRVEIDNATPEIIEESARTLGRGTGRSRQLARG